MKHHIPEVRDAISSPDHELLIVLTASELQIYDRHGLESQKPKAIFPIKEDESIVMAEWVEQDQMEEWSHQLHDDLITSTNSHKVLSI